MKLFNFSSSGAAALLLFFSPSLVVMGETESNWKVLDTVSLPAPLSDNTATYIPASITTKDTLTTTDSAEIGARTLRRRRTAESATATSTTTFIRPNIGNMDKVPARIYISGGCDANGLELDSLMCESISSKLYGFIPTTDTTMDNTGFVTTQIGGSIETLADMPRPRYKHSAVATSDGRLWLIGGRTLTDDTIIPEVDVYDPIMNTWTTVDTIPNEYLTSDSVIWPASSENGHEHGEQVFAFGGQSNEITTIIKTTTYEGNDEE